MRELTRSFVEAAYEVIGEGALSGEPLYVTDAKIRNLVEQVPLLNVRDRAHVRQKINEISRRARAIHDPRRMAEWLTSRSTFGEIYSASYSAEVAAGVRVVENTVTKGMSLNRGMSLPKIFYLVSSHQNPAEGHAKLQGTVLIDRFWRSALGDDEDSIAKVESYISSNGTLTVQEAMQGPYWLLTRPNCHHWLLPLDTDEVIKLGSDRLVNAAHPEATGGHRDFKDDHARYVRREKMFVKVRSGILAKLPTSVPRIHI